METTEGTENLTTNSSSTTASGLFDIKIPGQENPQGQGAQQSDSEKKPKKDSQFWVNVGIVRGDKLLTLPMGIPLDDLNAKPVPRLNEKNADFVNLREGERQLWEQFQKAFRSLKPGESQRLNFVVEVRRIKEVPADVKASNVNPYAIGEVKFAA